MGQFRRMGFQHNVWLQRGLGYISFGRRSEPNRFGQRLCGLGNFRANPRRKIKGGLELWQGFKLERAL
jgi:hypothetical protein